jgi:HlyD family secretion protein/epimerase transport system membrane fusion protein
MTDDRNFAPLRARGEILPARPVNEEDLARAVRRPMRLAAALTLAFLGGAAAWGGFVRLPAGAVAPGLISPDGSRKTVQHYEGGIIAALHVRDGDVVAAGQPLLSLESVQASTAYEALLNQYRTLLATQARLQAEQIGLAEIAFPEEVLAHQRDASLFAIVEGQRAIFETRKRTHETNKKILAQRIEQANEQIRALSAQLESASRQLELIEEELGGKQALQVKGIISKPELLRLQRAQAEIRGREGEYLGSIAKVRQQIGETQTQLLNLDAQRADQISAQLDQARLDLSVTRERLISSRDVLNRTMVSAPVSGTIVNMRFKTEGGVVQRGEPILDIVPLEDRLLIDARVAPTDVDVVHKGLSALIHLTAYANRGLPRISGTVVSVSADRIQDSQTTPPYFLARVEVDRASFQSQHAAIDLVPGMPAEVLIVTTERTFFEYLIEPFKQAFARSFRET